MATILTSDGSRVSAIGSGAAPIITPQLTTRVSTAVAVSPLAAAAAVRREMPSANSELAKFLVGVAVVAAVIYYLKKR